MSQIIRNFFHHFRLTRLWKILNFVVWLSLFLWCSGIVFFCFFETPLWQWSCLGTFIGLNLFFICLYRKQRLSFWIPLGIYFGLCLFYAIIQPSNNRIWEDSWSQMPMVQLEGDRITVTNLRDFHYRSTQDFEINYIQKSYRLSRLQGLDLVLSYWGSPAIAHVMLSFNFGEDGHLVISAETRLEKGEKQGTLPGIFKRYEILYILGTEEDLFQLRTHHRKEQLYLYKTNATAEATRTIFLDFAKRINRLREEPEFYNLITYNCLFSLLPSLRIVSPEARWHIQWLQNGYIDYFAFNNHVLARQPHESFEEFKKRSLVTGKFDHLKPGENYSQKIRDVTSYDTLQP